MLARRSRCIRRGVIGAGKLGAIATATCGRGWPRTAARPKPALGTAYGDDGNGVVSGRRQRRTRERPLSAPSNWRSRPVADFRPQPPHRSHRTQVFWFTIWAEIGTAPSF
jgi:hypothetical protein